MRSKHAKESQFLWFVGALVAVSLLGVTDASLGDRLPEFKECVDVCEALSPTDRDSKAHWLTILAFS